MTTDHQAPMSPKSTHDTPLLKGIPTRIWLCCGELSEDEETHFESIEGEDLCWTKHGPNDETDPEYRLVRPTPTPQQPGRETPRANTRKIAEGICNGFAAVFAKHGVTYSPSNSVETIQGLIDGALERETAALSAEVARLTGCIKAANANHEKFERLWYLEQDKLESAQQDLASARGEAEKYKSAIENCINWANGREDEWGDRAVNAFEFLHAALAPAQAEGGQA